MTIGEYYDSSLWYEMPLMLGSELPEDDELDDGQLVDQFAESFGRRINYGNVPEFVELFDWLGLYCSVLRERGSFRKFDDSGRVYEFSAKYFFGFAGIDYGGTTMRVEELRMLDGETVYPCVIPVMRLHIVVGGEMHDLPIYPGYNYWKEAMAFDKDFEIPFGDIVLRVVEKTDYDTGHEYFYFERYFSPVYVGYIRGGVNMLTDGPYLKWDSAERWMRRKAERFVNKTGEYEEKYESWSSDELRELTLEAMGYDMDEYRDSHWTDYLWE